jgi:outer membrane murein-binding lipoprotein Lpp
LTTIVVKQIPANEAQARPLTKLPPDQQAQAWQEAIQRAQDTGKRLTAALVEAVVQELQPIQAATPDLDDDPPLAPAGEAEQALVDAQALDDQGARVIEPPPVGEPRVRVTANEQEDFQAVAALLATCGVQLQYPQPGQLPKYPASWRAYGTLDMGELQQPVDSATPLEVAALHHTIRDLQQHVANLHTANDAELSQMNATIATLQARIAGLEGENERLREEAAAARGELERTYQHLARQDTPGAHQRVAQALATLESYQEHITRAQGYKPTSDRGEAVSPLLRLVEQVYITLKGGTSEP